MEKSTCCGDSFYGVLPTTKVKDLMRNHASEMPVSEVVVYGTKNSMIILKIIKIHNDSVALRAIQTIYWGFWAILNEHPMLYRY